MYSCLPFVDDSVIVKGNQKCCIVLWKCIYQVFCWGKHDLFVISESSITYMVLYSIYLSVLFFFKVCWSFEMSLYSTWCTNRTEKWRHPLSKGNPLALITSYHFIQQHQMCLCFILLCTAVLYEYVVAIMLKKYIKTLHSSSDFLMCHFFSHTLDTLY